MGRLRQSTEAIQRILDESDGLREFTERELNTLKGEGEGSIKQALNEVLGGASEAYDTLKEIEEYIERDEAGAVALAQSIARLETEKVSASDIDSALSTTSTNPVQNKVITEELGKKAAIEALTILGESVANSITSLEEKKANKTDVAQSDWNASKQEKGHILNRTHYVDLTYFKHLTINKNDFDLSFDGSYWIAEYKTLLDEEQRFVYCSADGKEFYSPIGNSEIQLPNYIYVKTIDVYSDDGDFVGRKLVVRNGRIDEEFRGESFYIADIWSYPHIKELPSIYIPDTIARQESVDELRDETTALWENLDHGVFPNLVAGDLAGRGESVPAEFGFRASGGKSIKDGRAYIKRIKGNSVVWNNIADWRGVGNTNYGITVTYDNGYIHVQGVAENTAIPFYSVMYDDATKPGIFIKNHRYMVSGKGDKFYLSVYGDVSITGPNVITEKTGESVRLTISSKNLTIGEEINETFPIRVVDLTKMFGAGNEPTTIEEFNARKPFVEDEYAYNEGQVIHCNTKSIKSVGDNAWDEEWIAGRLNTNTGQPNLGNNGISSKNYIRVLPNETYYCGYNAAPIFAMFYDAEYALITGVNSIRNTQFTTPANAAYMKFYVADDNLATYNNDICIRLAHTGYKTDYEPYWQDILPLPIISKYFPDGMKKAGSAHDEIRYNKASGKWEYSKGKIKSVDMGTLNWKMAIADQGYNVFLTDPFIAKYDNEGLNIINKKYTPAIVWMDSIKDKQCRLFAAGEGVRLYVRDTDYTDAASFKASLQGVMLYYESNDWEWVELDEADQNFRDYYNVADFGTEQSQSSVPSAPFSADIIYQFNAVDMIRENYNEIQKLKANGGNSYDDTEIKKQIASKVDANYVNSAINSAITNTLNTEV